MVIQQILSFIAVIKAKSYTLAAENQGCSKALLSRHVSQLEAYLGQTLLYRNTRRLSLTEAGEQFFQHALQIEESYQNALNALNKDVSGTLRITTTISLGSELFPPLIHNFSKKYPEIKVILSLSSLPEDIIEQRFDLSLRVAHTLPDSDLKVKPLQKLEMILCASPEYLKKHKNPHDFTSLKSHQCITSINRQKGQQSVSWLFTENNQPVSHNVHAHIEVDSIRAQLELVKLGSGIGRFPKMFVDDLIKTGELIQVLPQAKIPALQIFALYPNTAFVPAPTRCFLDFIPLMTQNNSMAPAS